MREVWRDNDTEIRSLDDGLGSVADSLDGAIKSAAEVSPMMR
ncbi:hypothetical protein [Mycobacterium sp. 1164966.3]|nr:hypothetical protein [Mycobacterium sp. 1164966.3]